MICKFSPWSLHTIITTFVLSINKRDKNIILLISNMALLKSLMLLSQILKYILSLICSAHNGVFITSLNSNFAFEALDCYEKSILKKTIIDSIYLTIGYSFSQSMTLHYLINRLSNSDTYCFHDLFHSEQLLWMTKSSEGRVGWCISMT